MKHFTTILQRARGRNTKSVLSRCVLFLLVEIPTTVAGVLWIFVPHYPELWQLETAAITVTSQLVSVQGHSPRYLMSLTTKVSFSVNIYQWMKLYLLSLSMESGGPKSILVSMSQAEHSPHLSGNITANILANRSGAMLCWWWHMWRLQECIRGQERPAPTSLVMMAGHRGHVLAWPLTDSLALTSGKMVHYTTQLSEPHSFWGLWGLQWRIAIAWFWI